jgi:hypothetical protein
MKLSILLVVLALAAAPALADHGRKVHVLTGQEPTVSSLHGRPAITLAYPSIDGHTDVYAGTFPVAPDRRLERLQDRARNAAPRGVIRLERAHGEPVWHFVSFTPERPARATTRP